jgi:hypothetical protein
MMDLAIAALKHGATTDQSFQLDPRFGFLTSTLVDVKKRLSVIHIEGHQKMSQSLCPSSGRCLMLILFFGCQCVLKKLVSHANV